VIRSENRSTRIDLEIKDDTAFVTLNGPPKNEMGIAFFLELANIAETTLASLQVRGMIVQGAGRHFSSGANVPEIEKLGADSGGKVAKLLKDNIKSFLTLSRLPYPVVALVRGCCLGAGMELALACHYRIAEQNAVFALPEVTWGIMPGCGGTIRLPALVGKATAVELILTGRSVLAQEALELGIADRVTDRGDGLAAALAVINNPNARPSI
jgi:enoyl-CoA hydratase/carnithine racemase